MPLSEGRLNNLFKSINDRLSLCLDIPGELLTRVEIFPGRGEQNELVHRDGNDYRRINLDDTKTLLGFHVVTGMSSEDAEEFSFGLDESYYTNVTVEFYIQLDRAVSFDTILDLKEAFPRRINDTDFRKVDITPATIITDQSEVFSDLYDFDSEHDHRFKFYLYKFEYELNILSCDQIC